jgi:hypothetical protein
MTILGKQIRDKFSMGVTGPGFIDDKPDLEYREWSIYLVSPNGGILGVDLVCREHDYYFTKATHAEFDYADSEGIIQYAKDLINQIEDFMASADGQQLNLLDSPKILEVKEDPDLRYPIEVVEF